MPPPRLPRPLRPWHPPRTSARARWVSKSPRDENTVRRDDGAPGGGEPKQPANEANTDIKKEPASSHAASATGWLQGLASRISTLFVKPSPPPLPSNSPIPNAVPPEDRPRLHIPSEHHSPPSVSLPEPPCGTTCLVCYETFTTPAKLRIHICERNHIESWPAAFQSREEVTERQERLLRNKQFRTKLGSEEWESGEFMVHLRDGKRVCKACQTPLPTRESLSQHWLSNDACRSDDSAVIDLFACRNCCKTFDSIAQARQHVRSFPRCLTHIRARDSRMSLNKRVAKLLPTAEDRYRRSIGDLLVISKDLENMSTPAALSLAHSIYEYLHPIYSQAYASRERRMLSLFGHVPQAFKAVQKLATQEAEQRMKPSASTEPTLGSKKASRRQRRSTEEPRGVPTLGHQGTEVVGSPSSSFGSRKKPNTGLEWKRKGIDPETNVTSHHEGLDPPRKVRKSTEHRTRTSDVKPRRDDGLKGQTVPSFEECLRVSLDSIQTDSTTLEIAQSPGLAAVPEEPASKEGQRLPSKGKPTVSFTEPNANHADLRLQLQYLMEQVRLLNEKIAAPTTAEGGTKQATTPHSASPTNHSTTQASDTPKVAKPVESPKTIALQQSDDTKVPLASSGDSANALVQPPVLTTSLASIDQSPNPTPVRRYDPKSQAKLQNERLKPVPGNNGTAQEPVSSAPSEAFSYLDKAAETSTDGQRLFRQIHTQARLMRSSDYSNVDTPTIQTSSLPPTEAPLENGERSEQSLLDELFPEASNYIQPHYGKRNPYPKLNPPNAAPIVRRYTPPREKLSSREKYIQAFQRSAEKMTTLQLLHCSTELTDADFRRLEPKGRHIEGWVRDDDFHQVIPGRDPLSLERLPFYYLIFKNPEAALRYQSNAMRLHKLSKLHGPDSSLSAIPPPPGLLENGEDINTALSSYLLTPTSQNLQLNMVVQPYNPALARLIEEGGYAPIVPSTNSAGTQIHKVLFYVEGYEPSPYDLYQIFMQDASSRGFAWPFLHEHLSIHRLRDIVDLKTRFRSVSANNPRASSVAKRKLMDLKDHDPYASFLSAKEGGESDDAEGQDAKTINQIIMNRVYNRWIVEFSEEAGARRFARLWHRKVLPMQDSVLHRTWRDVEEVRMCNAEYLW